MTSADHIEVRPGAYADSVSLLQISRDVAATPGVSAAQVAMATELNVELITGLGFEIPDATVNDMLVAIRADSADTVAAAVAAVDTALASGGQRGESAESALRPRTTASALAGTDAPLALVSVPGESATVEAMDAIVMGRDVMIFSDNVPPDQEVALKQAATRRGVLVMGPDCGTASVAGVGLGFANAVTPGKIGIVAASGTGCQQLMSLLDTAGVGISSAYGVGGRDLSAEVGALATREALRRLDADPATELIVLVSKPPDERIATELREFAGSLSTPVEYALLGAGRPDLTAAAQSVLAALGEPVPQWPRWQPNAPTAARADLLRGLFSGGTLCDEAMLLAAETLGPVYSNIPLDPAYALGSSLTAPDHLMIDFGDDALTAGRPHPMIDPTPRLDYLARTVDDPRSGVVLLDVVLGYGAHPDPADAYGAAIQSVTDRGVAVVAACVGTDGDPQRLSEQAARLAEHGAEVYSSNADATRRAIELIGGSR